MFRIALGVEYRGTAYRGWQRQSHAPSVQAKLEKALSQVADETISVHCAGRTDAGVHAHEQIVHFDTNADRPEHGWVMGTNTHLPDDICVRWAKQVTEDFHARFSATARTYEYIIDNRPVMPAIHHDLVTCHRLPLDASNMHKAAQYLIGEHDFSSFRASQCQSNTPMRNIYEITVKRIDYRIILIITANAFLHHMVRNIVGTLLVIGQGEQPPQFAQDILNARDRTLAPPTAPASGLYLKSVVYPKEILYLAE